MNIQSLNKAYIALVAMLMSSIVMCNVQVHAQPTTDSLSADEMEAYIINAVKEQQQQRTFRKVARTYRYRVSLTDKKDCGYSVKHPEAFLSAKAIARRNRYGLKVDAYDLPISTQYVKRITNLGGIRLHNTSKWNNTLVVETADTLKMKQVEQLPFVKSVCCVWQGPDSVEVLDQTKRADEVSNVRDTLLTSYYGYGQNQVAMLGVDQLHQAGYKGKGITVGVIDGGFYNADLIKGINQKQILGTRNFVRPNKSVYEELDHGMMVLSCMVANEPHYLVGTAPEANYYLLQSEDGESEQLIEEDNWCAALEYADSIGCDVVTSSLGYYHFDHSYMNHSYADLDGHTAINSKSASLAASRGLLVLNSAGNSGRGTWKKIGFPADACDMITVGAVDSVGLNTTFSSIGNSADGRIKPDVMAQGEMSMVYDDDGTVVGVNGTSFSCPIMCGAVVCLLQAFPQKRPTEIIRALQLSGNNAQHPDNIFGYGIPDVMKAKQLLEK